MSRAQAEAMRMQGLAEVEVYRAKMLVEMEALRLTAEAYSMYNETALRLEMIKALPDLAESIAKPLEKTEKIVFMGGGSGCGPGIKNGSGGQNVGAMGPSLLLEDMVRSIGVTTDAMNSIVASSVRHPVHSVTYPSIELVESVQ
uniref:Flotillin C-terminal domain-containing protein n=1 Tax=Timspurckia oligopyrenoides TaxID=708627 RepID=A0A7S0ZBC6_9RHOD